MDGEFAAGGASAEAVAVANDASAVGAGLAVTAVKASRPFGRPGAADSAAIFAAAFVVGGAGTVIGSAGAMGFNRPTASEGRGKSSADATRVPSGTRVANKASFTDGVSTVGSPSDDNASVRSLESVSNKAAFAAVSRDGFAIPRAEAVPASGVTVCVVDKRGVCILLPFVAAPFSRRLVYVPFTQRPPFPSCAVKRNVVMIAALGPSLSGQTVQPDSATDAVRDTARDLERAFVQEMLQHAGLAEAFAGEGGPVTDAFSGFLLEAVATQMVEDGGFGLAERFYEHLRQDTDQLTEAGRGQPVRL